jgi:hypothetical protein
MGRNYAERVTFDQAEFQIRCEWGLRGMRELAAVSDVLILIDVLSFTTGLNIATSPGRNCLSLSTEGRFGG